MSLGRAVPASVEAPHCVLELQLYRLLVQHPATLSLFITANNFPDDK